MAAAYGPTQPWHDLQLAITGPAVGDVECVFRERWNDPQPLSRNPLRRLSDSIRRVDTRPAALPPRLPDPPPRGGFARQLRLDLMAEHLGRDAGDDADLVDLLQAFDTCRATAEALHQWHERGGVGPRPAGRLRSVPDPRLGRWTRAWSGLIYRRLYDPDGRRRNDRRAQRI